MSMLDYYRPSNGVLVQMSLVFTAVFLLVYNYYRKHEWSRLPPGPWCFPLVGSLPFLGSDIREPIKAMGQKYGDVFCVYLGGRRVVILNSYDAIKEALVKFSSTFSNRPDVFFVKEITKGLGIVSANYNTHLWKDNRRFITSVLKDFGMGRTLLEDRINEELNNFLDYLQTFERQPVNPRHKIMKSVSNVICSVVFGRWFDYDDPRFILYMDIMEENFEVVGSSGILTVFPWLKHLPGDLFRYKEVLRTVEYMNNEFETFIREHRESSNLEEKPRDFIDAYLKAIDKDSEQVDPSFSDEQLVKVIGDLFGAGTETTTTTMLWAIIYMITYPSIQLKVQNEIDAVLEHGQPPHWSDRDRMPYAQACISELQRMADIVPFSVPHCTAEDVSFRGYFIPKNTMVLPSLYSVHRDPNHWPEPEEFNPERFLNNEGKLVKKEQLIPFSMGKRICLGEGIARMELFLFFVSLFQRFTISVPEGHSPPDLQGSLGITNMPKSFKMCLHSRRK